MTDEEKDALDYQLQRAMDMVRAMSKLKLRAPVCDAVAPADDADAPADGKDKKDSKDKK